MFQWWWWWWWWWLGGGGEACAKCLRGAAALGQDVTTVLLGSLSLSPILSLSLSLSLSLYIIVSLFFTYWVD